MYNFALAFVICAAAYLIGEAAGLISPSSLEGISGAMNSARALAESLQTPDPLRAYRRGTRRLHRSAHWRHCRSR